MATQKALNLPPIWERSSVTTTKVHVYVNGDNKTPGKEININKRTCPNFDIWLDQLTLTIKPRTGAIRRLFTPRAGHRVNSLDRLQNGDKLVAGGYEEFKPCDYEHITYPKKGGPRISYDVEPGHNPRYNVSARFRKVDSKALRIQCWVNGVPSMGAKPISIRQLGRPMTMELVMNDVHSKMKDMFREPVGRLYTFDGQLVKDLGQIEQYGSYVAAGEREQFKQGNYRDRSLPTNMSSSPSPRRSDRLPPITRSNKTSSQSSPEHSISSNNGYRRERAKREEDGVFHARPVKHKRSSEKVRQADYDQDQGGVFKAKSQNRATKGARQVEDSGQTKTDLPVDQRPAEEVKEDVKKKDKKDKKGKKQEENGSPHRYQDQERTYRANARRPDSPSNQQARQEAEWEARLKREAEDHERLEKMRQKREAARQKREEKDKKKREEENEKRKREEENEKRKREEEEEKRRREEEEERRQEEVRRRREEVEEERRRREEEERLWREEEARNAAEASRRDEYEDRPPEYSSAPRESSYRSGTDLLQDDQHRDERDNRTPDKETARGRNSRTDENRDNRSRADEEMDWGPGLEELRSMESEERTRAATTIQAGYRGMKARQEYKEMQLARGLDQYP